MGSREGTRGRVARVAELGLAGAGVKRFSLAAGVLGLLLLLGAALGSGGRHFWGAYLTAWFFFLTLGLGSLFFVLLHHVCRAGWSVVVRRLAEHVLAAFPLLALLGLPLALGVRELYPWTQTRLSGFNATYFRLPFFFARAVGYLLAWSVLAWWFRRGSLSQDRSHDARATGRLQRASAPALLLFAFTLTWAAFDWLMSLDHHWYSSIFGVYVFAGSTVGVLALLGLLASVLARGGSRLFPEERRHDLGMLLFGFVCFWAYIAFSQYLLMWYAALPEETHWFVARTGPGWWGVSVALALGHFVLPFFFFLPVSTKRNPATLMAGSVWMLAMHFLDLYWIIMPALEPAGARPRPIDALLVLGMAGVLGALVGRSMMRAPLVPSGDPRLEEALESD